MVLQLVERSTTTMRTTQTWYFVFFKWEFIIVGNFFIYTNWLLTINYYFLLPFNLNNLGIAIRLQLKLFIIIVIQKSYVFHLKIYFKRKITFSLA